MPAVPLKAVVYLRSAERRCLAKRRSESLYQRRSDALWFAEDLAPFLIEAFVLLTDLLLEFGLGFVHFLLEFFALLLDFFRLVFLGSFPLKLILGLSQLPL